MFPVLGTVVRVGKHARGRRIFRLDKREVAFGTGAGVPGSRSWGMVSTLWARVAWWVLAVAWLSVYRVSVASHVFSWSCWGGERPILVRTNLCPGGLLVS